MFLFLSGETQTWSLLLWPSPVLAQSTVPRCLLIFPSTFLLPTPLEMSHHTTAVYPYPLFTFLYHPEAIADQDSSRP